MCQLSHDLAVSKQKISWLHTVTKDKCAIVAELSVHLLAIDVYLMCALVYIMCMSVMCMHELVSTIAIVRPSVLSKERKEDLQPVPGWLHTVTGEKVP